MARQIVANESGNSHLFVVVPSQAVETAFVLDISKAITFLPTPIEAWQRAVSTTSEGRRVSTEVRLENCMQVLGVGRIGECAAHG